MLINEASKSANLTKKAIEYYTGQGLVSPGMLDNGYRNFSEADIERLKKISVLRKLGVCIEEIKSVLADGGDDALKRISVQKELTVQRERAKQALLDKLGGGKSYGEASADLKSIEQNAAVADRILEAFPGYYGRFICLHFARFLNEPVLTEEQQSAYEEIMAFLDHVPPLRLSEELQTYLTENTHAFNTETVNEMIEKTKHSIEHPEEFIAANKENLDDCLTYLQSDAYKKSLAYQMQTTLKAFNRTSGYNDVFIPAMKKLSLSYAEYCMQMETANERLLAQYPEIGKLENFT